MKSLRNKKHIWLPVVLLLYIGIMAYVGRDNYLNPATRLTYIVSIIAEIGIIVILYFVLRRKESLRRRREEADKRIIQATRFDNEELK